MSETVGNFEQFFDKLNTSHNETIKELFRIQATTVRAFNSKDIPNFYESILLETSISLSYTSPSRRLSQ